MALIDRKMKYHFTFLLLSAAVVLGEVNPSADKVALNDVAEAFAMAHAKAVAEDSAYLGSRELTSRA